MDVRFCFPLLVIFQKLFFVYCLAKYKAFGTLKNHALQSVFHAIVATTDIQCCRACSVNDSCVAANYEESTGTCELSNAHPLIEGAKIQTAVAPPRNVLFLTAGCRAHWSAFRGHCYLYNAGLMSWSDAEAHCVSLGGHIVDIHDDEENQFVGKFVTRDDIWIGMTDIWNGEPMHWHTGAATVYVNFNNGEPNNAGGNEDCVEMKSNTKWNDDSCSKSQASLCKKPCYFN